MGRNALSASAESVVDSLEKQFLSAARNTDHLIHVSWIPELGEKSVILVWRLPQNMYFQFVHGSGLPRFYA